MEFSPSERGRLLTRFHAELEEGETSDRGFGLMVGGAFVLLGVLPLVRHHATRPWMWTVGLALIAIAAVHPPILRAPKRAWLLLGLLMGQVVNPVVLGALFFAVITPAGWLMRVFGADPLRLHFDKSVATYWQPRTEPASDMNDQF